MVARIDIDRERIGEFCRKWKIRELALFGSVLRDDFRPDSDVDVLVTFEPDDPWHLMHVAQMIVELEEMFGRPVDLLEKQAIRNPFRRHAILSSHEVVYGG